MRILSFDTSNPVLSLALLEDGATVSARRVVPPESSRQDAISQLMPNVDDITRAAGWQRDSIDLLIVGVGPGSFTGMRTSVVTARTLAQALSIPLIGMDSLRVHAASVDLPATVVLSAGRGHYFIAAYRHPVLEKRKWEFGDGAIEAILEPRCCTRDELPQLLDLGSYCFTEEKILDEVKVLHPNCEVLPDALNLAEIQAQLATSQFDLNNKDRESLKAIYSFDTVNPLYLRGASITLKAGNEGSPS